MKKVFIILIPFFAIISGCEKIMHPEVPSTGNITNYEELSSVVAGVYGQLAGYIKYYDDFNLKGDDLNSTISSTSNIDGDVLCSRSMYSLDGEYNWDKLYKIIISTNNILIQHKNLSTLDKPTSVMIAEAHFLRAYCYFRLTRLFGQLPLIVDIEIDYNVTSASQIEIYEFIEKELSTAINYLPNNNSEARIPFVTPHRGVAKALLAEVYLNWAGYPVKDTRKYLSAAKTAEEVIDSSLFFGFRLMDDFAYVWDSNHFYNDESVFAVFYSNTPDYNNFFFEGCYSGEVGLVKSQLKYFLNFPIIRDINFRFNQVEVNFYNNFPDNYRKQVTFYKRQFLVYNGEQYPPIGFYIDIDSIGICDFMPYRKFFFNPRLINYDEMDDDYNTFYYVGNPKVYIYRYAQTLLTYAESKARSGQLDASAYEAVNMIRRRANKANVNFSSIYDLTVGLSADAFADSVVWERAWELCGEPEGRWYDLVRLEKVEDLPTIRDPLEGGAPQYPIAKDDYFFKKPASDLILNPNLN